MNPVTSLNVLHVAKKDDLFICHFKDNNWGARVVRIDDRDQEMEIRGNTEFVVDTLRLHVVVRKDFLVSYTFSDTNETMLAGEYTAIKESLTGKASYRDEETNIYHFNDLEDEVNYIRFSRRQVKSNYETIVSLEDVRVEWLGEIIDSGNPYIKPMATFGTKELDTFYTYFRASAMIDQTKEFFSSRGLVVDVPIHSDVRFLKYNDSYPFSTDTHKKLVGEGYVSRISLEEARRRFDSDTKELNAFLSRFLATQNGVNIPIDYMFIADKMRKMGSSLSKIEAKTKSYSHLNNLQTTFRELDKWLTERSVGKV